MGFSERAKLTALAIVHIFETSKPFGDYSAVAVLNDGAGISYGVNQFTHRSGSLLKVVERYLEIGGTTGKLALTAYLPLLRSTHKGDVMLLAGNGQFKTALKEAAKTFEMKLAQQQIAEECYLRPAIEACEGSDFELPLSLAVIYDSINHGSFERIRDRVVVTPPGNGSMKPEEFEKEWITRYVRKRDAWLKNHPNPLLRNTDYRTDFFLTQIARDNWQLRLPLNVHGYRLTEEIFEDLQTMDAAADPSPEPAREDEMPAGPVGVPGEPAIELPAADPPTQDQPPPSEAVGFAADSFNAYLPQIDTAKSWIKRATAGTTIGTVIALAAGLPQWLQIGLFALLVVIAIGGIVVFVKYHEQIFAYVTKMNTLRATDGTHNPIVSADTPKS